VEKTEFRSDRIRNTALSQAAEAPIGTFIVPMDAQRAAKNMIDGGR
jgi:hypothetical protein